MQLFQDSLYRAELVIEEVIEDDLDVDFRLLVENDVGATNYTIRFERTPVDGIA